MRLRTVVALLVVMPFAAFGQEATVQSGEHNGFTRLVAPLPTGAAWEVKQSGRTVTFSIAGFDQGFDISTVFELIPRDRVQDVRAVPDGIVVTLGCNCRVAPFVVLDRFVVMDIASPGVARPVPFVDISDRIERPNTTPQSAEVNTTMPALVLPLNPDDPQRDANQRLKPADLPNLARTPLSDAEQDVLNSIQERLAQELGTAATRGLLNPLPGLALPEVRRPQVELDMVGATPEQQTAEVPSSRPDGVPNNIRITSSMDFPNQAPKTNNAQSLSGFACPTDEEIDIGNWSDGRSFDQQMGEARQALYGEFDRLDRKVAQKLARLYLHFGFGAEAIQTLRLDPELAASEDLLVEIALIMENGRASENSALPSLLDCASDVALWAILAREELDVARSVDPSAALLALNKLPVHLRQFLAPALSNRLLSHGDTDAAATALRNLERLPSELPSSAKLAQARIAIDEGEVGKGADTLEDVIDDNAEQSPEALIELVETQLEAGQPLDPDTAGLIEAYAKELQGSELGPDLRRAHVLALAKSGQFDRAFTATSELGGDTEDPQAVKLRLQLLQELTTAAGDVVFLDHVFEQSQRDIARLPTRPKMALGTRLLDLGFAAQAQSVVEDIPDRPRNEERQILVARIALELDQPERAQAALTEMSGEQVDLLRAEASKMAGAFAEAYTLYRSANRNQAAAQAAWLAEGSDTMSLAADPLFGPVLALSETEISASASIEGMLARSTAALEESEAARRTLSSFLRSPALGVTGFSE